MFKGLQGAVTAHSAATARDTGANPSLSPGCTGLFYMRYKGHRTKDIIVSRLGADQIIFCLFRFQLLFPRPVLDCH